MIGPAVHGDDKPFDDESSDEVATGKLGAGFRFEIGGDELAMSRCGCAEYNEKLRAKRCPPSLRR